MIFSHRYTTSWLSADYAPVTAFFIRLLPYLALQVNRSGQNVTLVYLNIVVDSIAEVVLQGTDIFMYYFLSKSNRLKSFKNPIKSRVSQMSSSSSYNVPTDEPSVHLAPLLKKE